MDGGKYVSVVLNGTAWEGGLLSGTLIHDGQSMRSSRGLRIGAGRSVTCLMPAALRLRRRGARVVSAWEEMSRSVSICSVGLMARSCVISSWRWLSDRSRQHSRMVRAMSRMSSAMSPRRSPAVIRGGGMSGKGWMLEREKGGRIEKDHSGVGRIPRPKWSL